MKGIRPEIRSECSCRLVGLSEEGSISLLSIGVVSWSYRDLNPWHVCKWYRVNTGGPERSDEMLYRPTSFERTRRFKCRSGSQTSSYYSEWGKASYMGKGLATTQNDSRDPRTLFNGSVVLYAMKGNNDRVTWT